MYREEIPEYTEPIKVNKKTKKMPTYLGDMVTSLQPWEDDTTCIFWRGADTLYRSLISPTYLAAKDLEMQKGNDALYN